MHSFPPPSGTLILAWPRQRATGLQNGRKPFPINHGETSDETLLEDAIEVCKKFMERDPDELRFNAIALSAA
ncbi:hypothetical protein CB1_081988001 [Camelus ferus]|nr:hypothetical protein CB1_081988001 [Camelus ferus]